MGLTSACSTKILDHAALCRPAVAYCSDRIRFNKPVRVRDTVTVPYEIVAHPEESNTTATVIATNQHGDFIGVAGRNPKCL